MLYFQPLELQAEAHLAWDTPMSVVWFLELETIMHQGLGCR